MDTKLDFDVSDRKFYDTLNRGVHRHSAEPLGAPALVWHLALWRHPPTLDPPATDEKLPSDIIREAIISVAQRAYQCSSKDGLFHCYGFLRFNDQVFDIDIKDIDKPENRARIKFLWHGIQASIELEVHSEYTTITSRLDLEVRSPGCRKCEDRNKCRKRHFVAFFNTINSSLISGETKGLKGVYNYFYFSVWKEFAYDILGDYKTIKSIGILFVDIRGLMTVPAAGILPNGSFTVNTTNDILPNLYRSRRFDRGVPHKYGKPLPLRNDDLGNEDNPQANWARQWISKIWPIIRSAGAERGIEYTASTLIRGRSLFVSSMGGRPLATKRYEQMQPWGIPNHAPIIFYINTWSDDSFQNGRLIDRILQAGTMRLASLVDLDNLREAAQKIQGIEHHILLCRSALDEMVRFKSLHDNKKTNDDISLLYDEHWIEIYERDNKIEELSPSNYLRAISKYSSSQYFLSQSSFTVMLHTCSSGTLDQRLERSMQYIARFNNLSAALDIGRIEGFQPYDEYVNRRLGRAFTFIHTLDRQVENLRREMESLYRYYSADSLQSITKDIDKQERGMEEIQRVGEDVLFLGILPHYLGGVLSEITKGVPFLGENSRTIWISSVLLSYGLYFYKAFREYLIDKLEKKRVVIVEVLNIDAVISFLREKNEKKYYFVYAVIWACLFFGLLNLVIESEMSYLPMINVGSTLSQHHKEG